MSWSACAEFGNGEVGPALGLGHLRGEDGAASTITPRGASRYGFLISERETIPPSRARLNPAKFRTRREAKDWCANAHEIGADAAKRAAQTKARKAPVSLGTDTASVS
jgi:hypothetical protein